MTPITNTSIHWSSKYPNSQIIYDDNHHPQGLNGTSVSLLSQRTTSNDTIGFQFQVHKLRPESVNWQGVIGFVPTNKQHNSNYRDMKYGFEFFSSKNTNNYKVNRFGGPVFDSSIGFSSMENDLYAYNIIYKIVVQRTTNTDGNPIDKFKYYKTTDSNNFGEPIYTEETTTINDSYIIKLSNINNATFSITNISWVLNPDRIINDTNNSQTGGGGDPYLITLDNKLYKMQNFQGYSRMLQGLYLNKLLTINVSTRMSTAQEAEESKQYVLKNIENIENKFLGSTQTFLTTNYLNEQEAFMDKLFISWDNQQIIIDMDKLTILDNQSNFIINNLGKNSGNSFKDCPLMSHYQVLEENSLQIIMNHLSVIVSTINNPQVKTGFRILNGDLISKPSGALANTLFGKDIKIKKLHCIKPINRRLNRMERRIKTEYYINNNNQQIYKKIPIF